MNGGSTNVCGMNGWKTNLLLFQVSLWAPLADSQPPLSNLTSFPPSTQGYQCECLPGSELGHPPPATSPVAAAPTSGKELELHYATLSFQGQRLGEPPHQEATSTEYAEIKIHT